MLSVGCPVLLPCGAHATRLTISSIMVELCLTCWSLSPRQFCINISQQFIFSASNTTALFLSSRASSTPKAT
ncbi:hypothetical protein BDW74DRAFT_162057 [Aspergillus multicolor]|uniref:uncharacterized protein n=1 Tax=Aspergillus multicolor TaxID=41759 RepID=UPI003CCD80AD